ncbi:lysophospholipid acyltransferase [Terramyces sp. JEL0728]|nr:lysophospholipid acyltransferase [Terramyces sp. JEL0728]
MEVIYENRYLVTLILNFPLSYVYTLLNPKQRQVFSIITSTLMTIGLFSFYSFVRVVVPSLLVYFLTRYSGSRKSTPYMCLVVGASSTQVLGKGIDDSAILMVLFIKQSSFAFSVYDSTRKDLDEYQTEYQIKEFPDLLEYMSFMMFYIHFVVGPAVEFKSYQDFLKKQTVRLPTSEIYKNLGLVVVLAYLQSLPLHFKDFYQDWFLQLPFLYKVLYVQISGIIVRSKYYCAWKISLVQSLIVGLDKDKCANVVVHNVEFGENIKMMMDNWNIFTANWLRRYIYNRYYLCFIGAVPAQQASRLCRKILKPMFKSHQKVYDVLGWFLSIFCLNFLVVAFQLKRLDYGLLVWKSMYFCGIIGPVLVYGFLYAYTVSNSVSKKRK